MFIAERDFFTSLILALVLAQALAKCLIFLVD